MEKITGGEFYKSLAETYYEGLTGAYESLSTLDNNYLSIDEKSLTLCSEMLRNYTDKLECRKGAAPEIPDELQVVMSLLDKLTTDMNIIRDIIADDIKLLRTE